MLAFKNNQTEVIGQEKLIKSLARIINIFESSEGEIRPHFILTGPSGTGKSLTIKSLAEERMISFLEINAAQLTKEGTSGNSLSKALSPLLQIGGELCICFVDEFDKLFISGNSNSSLAHEYTTGVQNEFLRVLESDNSNVFGDYGKYIPVSTKNVLFVFAGAWNGEENIDLDRLRELGVKTEFLGRVGLVFNTKALTMQDLETIVDTSPLLENYSILFNVNKEEAANTIKEYLSENFKLNTLGARLVNTLIHKFFIEGGLEKEQVKEISFQKKLEF